MVAPTAELLAQLVREKSPALVLLAGTAEGKEIAGRLAVKTDSGVLTDAVDLTPGDDGNPVAEQSIFGGATIVHSRVKRGTPDRRDAPQRGGARACARCGRAFAGVAGRGGRPAPRSPGAWWPSAASAPT